MDTHIALSGLMSQHEQERLTKGALRRIVFLVQHRLTVGSCQVVEVA